MLKTKTHAQSKLTGKLVSVMAAVALAASMAIAPASAFALNTTGAVDDSGNPATTGNIHVHKYKTSTPSGIPGTGADNQALPTDATPLDGVGFTLYKLDTATVEGATPGTAAATAAPSQANVSTFLANYEDTSFTAQMATTGAANPNSGKADFTGLAFGYYLLVETTTPTGVQAAVPSIIAVPYADTVTSGGTTTTVVRADVHVYPKNASTDPVTKTQVNPPAGAPAGTKLPGQTVVPGDNVAYQIATSIPAPTTPAGGGTLSSVTSVYLEDILPVNTLGDMTLAIQTAGMVVTAVQQSGASFVIPASDYTYVAATAAGAPPVAANTARWTLDAAALASINAVAATDPVVKVKVDFIAQVTNDAFVTGVDTNGQPVINNQATAEVVDPAGATTVAPGTPGTTPSVPVATAGFKFTKTEADGTTALAGATFALAPTYADATAGNYLAKPTSAPGTTPSWTGATAWTETSAATTGLVTFAGLGSNLGVLPAGGGAATAWTALDTAIAGLTNGTSTTLDVWVVETSAPTGFRLLQAPQKITLTISKDATGNVTANAGNFVGIVNVKNGQTGGGNFALPNTGGAGTIAFAVVGLVLIGSAVYYFARRRKNGEQH